MCVTTFFLNKFTRNASNKDNKLITMLHCHSLPLKASACCSIELVTIFQKHSETAILRFRVVI